MHKNVKLFSHVCICGPSTIDEGSEIYPFASIGHKPQDLKYHGELSRVYIGKYNSIREYVTIHPGTEQGTMETKIGDNCLLMAHVHIAHDCVVGSNIVFANAATLAGHVTVEDNAVLGGLCAVHQWVRIGESSMIGGMSGVERDVLPYSTVEGNRATIRGVNILGLKRRGISLKEINALKILFEKLFDKTNVFNKNVELIDKSETLYETGKRVMSFIKAPSKRSFCTPYSRE